MPDETSFDPLGMSQMAAAPLPETTAPTEAPRTAGSGFDFAGAERENVPVKDVVEIGRAHV